MVSAIGSSPAYGNVPATGAATAGLESQITRYKKELSDCVNCASARTPEGKAKIQAIAAKIGAAEARIEKITSSGSASHAIVSSTASASVAKPFAPASTAQGPDKIEAALTPRGAGSTTGSRVDVFA